MALLAYCGYNISTWSIFSSQTFELIVSVSFSIITFVKSFHFLFYLYFVGDHQLHLQTVKAMHPFFPASGHNNYSKSIQIYLQDMEGLSQSNPDVHKFFSDGSFVTRRSNRYWSGLPDDLVIEQVKWHHKFLLLSIQLRVKLHFVTYWTVSIAP